MKPIKNVSTIIAPALLLLLFTASPGFAQTSANAPSPKPNQAKTNKSRTSVASKNQTQQTSKNSKVPASGQATAPDKKKPVTAITEKRRTELLNFCKQHHEELIPLLESLQKKRPAEFEKALRTLDREIKQLQMVKSKERYEKLLAQWVLRSKIKLLSARLAVRTSKEQRAKTTSSLSKLIGQLQDLKIKHLNEEREATKARLTKISAQIDQLRSTRDAEIKKQIESFTKNAERIQAAQKAKAAGKNKSKNSGKPATAEKDPAKKNQAKKNQAEQVEKNKK